MRILGIETSCDETSVAVLDVKDEKNISVLANVVSSQVKLHAPYGGVVPNLAAREHARNIGLVFDQTLKEAGIKDFEKEIELIAVTRGPGLGPALVIGLAFAKTLAWIHKKPLVGVSHLEGHIYSNWLPPSSLTLRSFSEVGPALNLIVSGGHTELVLMKDHGTYELVGETLDDAAGEAFDKVARLLGLGYPGGPNVAQRAAEFKVKSSKLKVEFLKPMTKSGNFNFSFSGLKTAVLYKLRELEKTSVGLTEDLKNQICFEFQKTVVDSLVEKTIAAARKHGVQSILLSGGVSANTLLRQKLSERAKSINVAYAQPEMAYTTDNAAMIALAGWFNYVENPPSLKLRRARAADAFNWQSATLDANLGF